MIYKPAHKLAKFLESEQLPIDRHDVMGLVCGLLLVLVLVGLALGWFK